MIVEEEPETQTKQFLTLEVYDPMFGEENYSELIDRNRDPATGKTLGLSKWQNSESP